MQKKGNLLILILGISFMFNAAYAQSGSETVYFTGLGRGLFQIDKMTDEKQRDSRQRASSGYTLFDLGINLRKGDLFRAGAILRLRNEFGGFFADGVSLDIRQIQMEGTIGNKVKYEIGDIYLKQTPYTLWNFEESYHNYEGELFGIRRSIVNYENFFVGKHWRVQGVNPSTRINFSKGIESIGIRAYGARILPSDLTSIPDRFLYGANVNVKQGKYGEIGGNFTGISDIIGTVEDAQVQYDNKVATVDYDLKYDKQDNFNYALEGESGISQFALSQSSSNTEKNYADYFIDVGANVEYEPLNIKLGIKYRDVGPYFNSPGSQTRRINDINNISLSAFNTYNDGSTNRPMSLFDRYSQESGLYNTGLSTTLLPYLPQYNNIEPYGKATPNRQGITLHASYEDEQNILSATAKADFLSEIQSEGDSVSYALRNYTGIRGGFNFNIHNLAGYQKDLVFKSGARYEHTSRDGAAEVDFTSLLLDASTDIEVIDDLHLLTAMKMLSANGNEFVSVRNDFNEITAFNDWLIDLNDRVYSIGIKYDFTETVFTSMQYQVVNYRDKRDETNNFDMDQWFFTFNMRF